MTAAFTGARLDRAGDGRRRDAAWLSAQRSDPRARAVHAGTRGVVMDGHRLALHPLAGAGEPLLLGVGPGGPLFAVDLDAPAPGGERAAPLIAAGGARGTGASAPPPAHGPRPVGLREAVAVLPQDEGGLVAYVAALLNWHRRHGFCAACGTLTELAEGGLVRRCPRCATQHHPRTDPVVIMLVTDADRVLLGRAPSWPPRRYSALAGFVEPGESLEEAVAREVEEETGVEIADLRYHGSQPWPFPASLMVGFHARYAGGEAHAADAELEDVRWFTRGELAAVVEGRTEFHVPPPAAIARRLIDEWLERA